MAKFDPSTAAPESDSQPTAGFDPSTAQPVKPAGAIRRIADMTAVPLMQGVVGVPEAAVGLADLVTGGAAGKAAEDLGFRPREAKQIIGDALYSDEQKDANRKVAQAEGFLPTLQTAIENPSTIVRTAAESVPAMFAGGAVSRVVRAAAPGVTPLAAGAAGEGAIIAGQTAEQIRQETPDGLLRPDQAALAGGAGVGGAVISRISGGLAGRMGIGDFETAMARGGLRQPVSVEAAKKAAEKGIARKAGEGAFVEGVLEELPQSMLEQVSQNLALGKPWNEGLGNTAAMGMLAGGLTGGVVGPLTSGQPQQQDTPPAAPPQKPLLLTNQPDPLIGFPDGTVARRSEVDAYLASLPPAERAAASEKMFGIPPGSYRSVTGGTQQPMGPISRAAAVAPPPEALPQPEPEGETKGGKGETKADQAETLEAPKPVAFPIDPNAGPISRAAALAQGMQAQPESAGAAGAPAAPEAAPRETEGFAPQPGDIVVDDHFEGAHAAATSPLNDRPEPTEAQKHAENYPVGRTRVAGMSVSVENPQGSERKGEDPDGKPWSTLMRDHYGRLLGTIGADSTPQKRQHLDVFVKAGTPKDWKGQPVIIDTLNLKTGRFDEHKLVFGADSVEDARAVFARNYDDGERRIMAATAVPMPDFKRWAYDGQQKSQPFAQGQAQADLQAAIGDLGALMGQPAQPLQRPKKPDRLRAARLASYDRNPMLAFLAQQGLYHAKGDRRSLKTEFSPDRQFSVPGYHVALFRRDGKLIDQLVQPAIESGFLPQGATEEDLYELVTRAMRGERVIPIYAEGVAEQEFDRQMREREESARQEAQASQEIADFDDDVLVELAQNLDDVPSLDAQSNTDVESAMRALGFTEEEIRNDAEAAQRPEETSPDGQGDRGAVAPAEGQAARAPAGGDQEARAEAGAAQDLIGEAPSQTQQAAARERARREQQQRQQQQAAPGPEGFTLGMVDARNGQEVDPNQQDLIAQPEKPREESDQERSNREWLENYQRVSGAADLSTISTKDIERAIHFASMQAARLGPGKAWDGDEQAKKQIDAYRREIEQLEFELKLRRERAGVAPAAAPAQNNPAQETPSGASNAPPPETGTNGKGAKPPGGAKAPKPPQKAKLPKAAKPTPSADTLRAQADLQNALADLGDLLGRNVRKNIVPEQEAQLVPILTRVLDAAFRLGYHKFKDAAKFALDQIRGALGGEVADALTLQHLQGAYIAMSGGKAGTEGIMDVAAVTSKGEIEAHTAQQETEDVSGGTADLERDSGEPAAQPPAAPGVRGEGPGQPAGGARAGGGARAAGRQGAASPPDGGPVAGGERVNIRLDGGGEPGGPAGGDPRADLDDRGSGPGASGAEPQPHAGAQPREGARAPASDVERRKAQRDAERVAVTPGDRDNIAATLPYLLPAQQDDVLKAEQRFAKPDGYGMLFTNGTGTGKTFTGLGIVKRLHRQGKANQLIVVPDNKIAADWIESAKALGLTITQLPDTKTAGEGIVITTYANLGENDELAKRKWDHVLADEAHSLMQSADGVLTGYLDNLRALTYHQEGQHTAWMMRHREQHNERESLSKQIQGNSRILGNPDTMEQMVAALREENRKLEARAAAIDRDLAAKREAIRREWAANQGGARTRATFLSATPFAYHTSLEWAQGYLFSYAEGYPYEVNASRRYNQPDPRQHFFMTHLGYRMRYNKLTKPDASKVDVGMLERQLNSWMKRQGSLSGRMLEVEPDYDRRFVAIDSAIGNKIDEALEFLRDQASEEHQRNRELPPDEAKKAVSPWAGLDNAIRDQFDFLSRRYLLEAIKAKEAVPIVRQHMALGRRVVVFHDYKQGSGNNPFDVANAMVPPRTKFKDGPEGDEMHQDMVRKVEAFNAAREQFRSSFPELFRELVQLRPPLATFREAFTEGQDLLVINGDEKPKDLLARYKQFQSDEGGPLVMLVQSDKNKGWSGHDTTGKFQRVLINLGLPTAPTKLIQLEGRIYRTGVKTDAIMRSLNTGTNWERWAFATTIASRASTAENLGMGELSRALRDSIIASFEAADRFQPGHDGEGQGGKAMDRAANEVLTDFDRAKTYYWATGKKTSRNKAEEGKDYYATPEPLGLKMVEWADIRAGEDALEPSGGHGAIARWIPDLTNRTVIEPSPMLLGRLGMVMDPAKDRIIDGTFEDHDVVNKYDAVVMNPPFGVGGKQAVEHVAKAARHLRPGGRIVALLPAGPAADKRLEQFLYGKEERKAKPLGHTQSVGDYYEGDEVRLNGYDEGRYRIIGMGARGVKLRSLDTDAVIDIRSHYLGSLKPGPRTEQVSPSEGLQLVADIKLPQSTFERAGTQVASHIIVLEKTEADLGATRQIDLSDVGDINALFDRIEDLSIRPRTKPAVEQGNQGDAAAVQRSGSGGRGGERAPVPGDASGRAPERINSAITELNAARDIARGSAKSHLDGAIRLLEDDQDVAGAVSLIDRAMRISGFGDFQQAAGRALAVLQPQPPAAAQPSVTQTERGTEPIIEHVTAKGKTLRGIVRKGITKAQAQAIDPYTFSKDGGFFIREKHLQQDGGQFALEEGSIWRSELTESIAKSAMQQAPAKGWQEAITGMVKAGKVKADEVEWSGIREWLQLQGAAKVPKQAVMDFLADNGVRVEEVVKGDQQATRAWDDAVVRLDALGYTVRRHQFGPRITRRSDNEVFGYDEDADSFVNVADDDGQRLVGEAGQWARVAQNVFTGDYDADEIGETDTRYSQYALPGGENYRELLLTLPQSKNDARLAEVKRLLKDDSKLSDEELASLLKEEDALMKVPREHYRSGHWYEPNIVAHIRMDDRTDAEGKRVLFIEELQSDWAQKGRREGFMPRDPSNPTDDEVRAYFGLVEGADPAEYREEMVTKLEMRRGRETDLTPRAPFVEKTDAWLSLALKRIVKMAADGGYDRVAFVNGQQSADRYDLSKQIDDVTYDQNMDGTYIVAAHRGTETVWKDMRATEKVIEDTLGKDIAKRIIEGGADGTLRGLDLKVGGEGMIAFYDKIVPAALNKLLPKVGGGKMQPVGFGGKPWVIVDVHDRPLFRFQTEQEAREYIADKYGVGPDGYSDDYGVLNQPEALDGEQPGFDVTPAMREAAARGMPLFRIEEERTPGGLTMAQIRERLGARSGLPVPEVEAIVQRLTAGWKGGIEVRVVPTHRQLPGNAPATAKGMYANGVGYVVASKVRNVQDAGRILAHEVIQHHGERNVLGEENWRKLMAQIQAAANAGNPEIAAAREYVRQAYRREDGTYLFNEGETLEADEVAARLIEQSVDEDGNMRPRLQWLKWVWAKIAAFLRDTVALKVPFTMAELQGIWVESRRALERGAREEMVPEPALAARENPELDGIAQFWRHRSWQSEAEARDMIRRRIIEDNERYPMFKPTDPALADLLQFTRAAGGKVKLRTSRADLRPRAPYPLGPSEPEFDAPDVDWEASDLDGVSSEDTALQEYGRGRAHVYRAWVDASVLPPARGEDITGGSLNEDSGAGAELRHRGSPPPIKVRVGPRGKVEILDGNHRLAFWREAGYGSIPAYVVDERSSQSGQFALDIAGNTGRYTPEQLQAMRNVGFATEAVPLKDRLRELWKNAGKMMAQGLVDQFAPIKDISREAYGLLRLSKGASGAFEVMLQGGLLKLNAGVYDFDETKPGGAVQRLLIPLQGEHHDFFRWVAANRAEQLTREDREHLFTADDIRALKTLADGQLSFDYKLQHGPRAGQTTRSRAEAYADSLKTFNEFNKNTLDMAEQSGLIDGESRSLWEKEFYVPFYRVADEGDGGIRGMNIKSGVVRQQAFKHLKGGSQQLNTDLLENTLMNWAHLLDAAAKNRAAKATLEAMQNMGSAIEARESEVRAMAKSMGKRNNVVWFMDAGRQRHFLVDDPYLLAAVSALEFAGFNFPVMKAMGTFKHVLTVGVTASPFFKVRNLIRDSVQAIGTAPLGANPLGNVAQGWALTKPGSEQYFRLLAGGGTIHFGTMMEGSEAKRVQALVEAGVDQATILDSTAKVKAFYRKTVEPLITAYNELGNRGEAVNRAALYEQLRRQGVSHAEASLQARDLMDFSMQGSFTTVRFLTQVVPFLNARMQGLHKLGRAAAEDPARFSAVLGAAALLSIGLLAAYSDDDDWKKREEWDRNNYWWFKAGGIAYRIPKPFEIGAIATLAERSWELAFDEEMTGRRFREQVIALLGDNLAMNPLPQIVKPVLDVYANRDSFTGRPVETMGMERLRPDFRFTENTTMFARGLSTTLNAGARLVGGSAPSPVQIDHLLRGYFGWLGAMIVSAGDVVARPATDQPARPQPDYWKVLTGAMVATLEDATSRYVSAAYTQAKELEQVYGTWRHLLREGKVEEAQAFREDYAQELVRYRQVEAVKRAMTTLNQLRRQVEQGEGSPQEKRERIRELNERSDAIARRLAPAG